jgi:hypothetical protein
VKDEEKKMVDRLKLQAVTKGEKMIVLKERFRVDNFC